MSVSNINLKLRNVISRQVNAIISDSKFPNIKNLNHTIKNPPLNRNSDILFNLFMMINWFYFSCVHNIFYFLI